MARIRFNFENKFPTFNPSSAPSGRLFQLFDQKRGLGISIRRASRARFDITSNVGTRFKGFRFGRRSIDPFSDMSSTPFVVNFSSRVFSFSVRMGDQGGDNDVLRVQAFSRPNGRGRLLDSTVKQLSGIGSKFSSKVLTVRSRTPIYSIRMIGGSTSFPNSVYYDNIVVNTRRR